MTPAPPTVLDRLMRSVRAIIKAEVARLLFLGPYEYTVQGTDGTTADIAPVDPATGLPAITKVPLYSGACGGHMKAAIGSVCVVVFLNGDRTKPRILGFDQAGAQNVTLDTGTGTSEHIATIEGVLNLFVNFLFFLSTAGDISTWKNVGKILDTTQTATWQNLATAFSTWMTNCTSTVVPIASSSTGGGLTIPALIPFIQAAIAAKSGVVGDLAGTLPGVGCQNLQGG